MQFKLYLKSIFVSLASTGAVGKATTTGAVSGSTTEGTYGGDVETGGSTTESAAAGSDTSFDNHLTVAASRMGNLQNPAWCFINTPFYPLPGDGSGIQGTDPSYITIQLRYSTATYLTWLNEVQIFACESL